MMISAGICAQLSVGSGMLQESPLIPVDNRTYCSEPRKHIVPSAGASFQGRDKYFGHLSTNSKSQIDDSYDAQCGFDF